MIGADIQQVAELLREGKLVAIPTETVYGLAANALNEHAVTRIFEVKNRPSFDPLIIHTNSLEKVSQWVEPIPPLALKLAQAFWAGSLTLILPKKNTIPDLVTSGLSHVGVRIPRHPLTLKLLQELDFPLAAPSANPFGYISPTTAQHVENQLGDKIPYILDGGASQVGIESTIVSFKDEQPTVLRKGGISIEDIEAVIGAVKVQTHSSSNPQAPGMLKSHYAPKVPLVVGDIPQLLEIHQGKKIGILSFEKKYTQLPDNQQFILSSVGDFGEAARNLFAYLRELDALDLDIILSEKLPEQGLGRAINDRIARASTRS